MAEPSRDLSASLAPDGAVVLSDGDGPIAAAFARGRGRGLLHLAAAESDTDLHPTLGFLRELSSTFLRGACATVDRGDPRRFDPPPLDDATVDALLGAVPPMRGGELVSADLLRDLWGDVEAALRAEADERERGVEGFLAEQGASVHAVGRVCFHLAEDREQVTEGELPFVFMATYLPASSKGSSGRRIERHRPLLRALQEEYAGEQNKTRLLSLLEPLSRAAEQSQLMRELIDSGDIYHPLSWSIADAHRFLTELDTYERCGLAVRVPAWWNRRRRPRPRVRVSVGDDAPSELGMAALLEFDVGLTLNGEQLSQEEIQHVLQADSGLTLIRGAWVEVDKEQLRAALNQWDEVREKAKSGQLSFAEAMRMLSGAELDADEEVDDGERQAWSEVVAGKWLHSALEQLRRPSAPESLEARAGVKATLRPYQREGVAWLRSLRAMGLGGCLADDMGLGKTLQVLSLVALARADGEPRAAELVVVPASLLANWDAEAARFVPQLKVLTAHRSALTPSALKQLTAAQLDAHDLVLTTYGTLSRLPVLKNHRWQSVILDEAQAIKNPGARQTKAAKALSASWKLALTGTPVENNLGDLWSIYDFMNPGLLGSAKQFKDLTRRLSKRESQTWAPLRELIKPYLMRRLKTDKSIIADLPDKTEVTAWCQLSKEQAALYKASVDELAATLKNLDGIERRGAVLSFLLRFKQICNHPAQWTKDDDWAAGRSAKIARLTELCEPIAARQQKVLVFTQFRSMTGPLAEHLSSVFGQEGLVIHGGTPVKRRQKLVDAFQGGQGQGSQGQGGQAASPPFMVLSLKAGGTGLNLTAASHVIHFDRWWNPAVEHQATDRAFRIGQKNNVLVHKFVCRGTVEERIDRLLQSKQELADELLSESAEGSLTELSDEELLAMVSLDAGAIAND